MSLLYFLIDHLDPLLFIYFLIYGFNQGHFLISEIKELNDMAFRNMKNMS